MSDPDQLMTDTMDLAALLGALNPHYMEDAAILRTPIYELQEWAAEYANRKIEACLQRPPQLVRIKEEQGYVSVHSMQAEQEVAWGMLSDVVSANAQEPWAKLVAGASNALLLIIEQHRFLLRAAKLQLAHKEAELVEAEDAAHTLRGAKHELESSNKLLVDHVWSCEERLFAPAGAAFDSPPWTPRSVSPMPPLPPSILQVEAEDAEWAALSSQVDLWLE